MNTDLRKTLISITLKNKYRTKFSKNYLKKVDKPPKQDHYDTKQLKVEHEHCNTSYTHHNKPPHSKLFSNPRHTALTEVIPVGDPSTYKAKPYKY